MKKRNDSNLLDIPLISLAGNQAGMQSVGDLSVFPYAATRNVENALHTHSVLSPLNLHTKHLFIKKYGWNEELE